MAIEYADVLREFFRRAAKAAGGQAQLAARMEVSRQALNRSLKGDRGSDVRLHHVDAYARMRQTRLDVILDEISDLCREMDREERRGAAQLGAETMVTSAVAENLSAARPAPAEPQPPAAAPAPRPR